MFDKFKVTLAIAMAFSAVALYYGCCPTTPPTRHYISLTRTANIYEMHEWIVIPGMPGFLDVCMHCCLYVCIDAFCVTRIRFCGLRTFMICMNGSSFPGCLDTWMHAWIIV